MMAACEPFSSSSAPARALSSSSSSSLQHEDQDTIQSSTAAYILTDISIPILDCTTNTSSSSNKSDLYTSSGISTTTTKTRPSSQSIAPAVLSHRYLGLVVHCTVAGAVSTFFSSAYCPLLVASLGVYSHDQSIATHRFFEWQGALAVFIGMAFDAYVTTHYRRKAVLAAGWIMAVCAFGGITILSFYYSTSDAIYFGDPAKAKESIALADIQSRPVVHGYVFLFMSALALKGVQVTWVVSLIMVVQLAKREPLERRGKLVALYLLIFSGSSWAVQAIVAKLLYPSEIGGLRAAVDLGEAAMVLTLACGASVPFVMLWIPRDPRTCRERRPIIKIVQQLWEACQDRSLSRMAFFLLGHTLLLGAYNAQARAAVAQLCGVSRAISLNIHVAQAAVTCVALFAWRRYLRNTSWRLLAVLCSLLRIVLPLLLTLCVAYSEAARSPWLYGIVDALQEPARILVKLVVVLFATEISEPGRVGSTLGLLLSLEQLTWIAAATLSDTWSSFAPLDGSKLILILPDQVVVASLVAFILNLSSLLLIPLLPDNKPHENQRADGHGHQEQRNLAQCVVAVSVVVLFVFDGTVNAMGMVGGA